MSTLIKEGLRLINAKMGIGSEVSSIRIIDSLFLDILFVIIRVDEVEVILVG